MEPRHYAVDKVVEAVQAATKQVRASMEPRHYAVDKTYKKGWIISCKEASMEPRHYAVDKMGRLVSPDFNHSLLQWSHGITPWIRLGSPASPSPDSQLQWSHGITPWIRGMTHAYLTRYTDRFNGATALRRG